jgi:hypothetical protein
MSIEAALVALGAAAVRSATKLWLGDRSVAAAVGSDAVDLLAKRLTTRISERKLRRMIEDFTDAVAERITPMMEYEYRARPGRRVAHDPVVVPDPDRRQEHPLGSAALHGPARPGPRRRRDPRRVPLGRGVPPA